MPVPRPRPTPSRSTEKGRWKRVKHGQWKQRQDEDRCGRRLTDVIRMGRAVTFRKVLSTPPSAEGVVSRERAAGEGRGELADAHCGSGARDDRRDERSARAARRADGSRHHRGFRDVPSCVGWMPLCTTTLDEAPSCRAVRFEVAERMAADGTVLVARTARRTTCRGRPEGRGQAARVCCTRTCTQGTRNSWGDSPRRAAGHQSRCRRDPARGAGVRRSDDGEHYVALDVQLRRRHPVGWNPRNVAPLMLMQSRAGDDGRRCGRTTVFALESGLRRGRCFSSGSRSLGCRT